LIYIGIGGVIGLLSIFVDWDWKISIKWLAALIIISSFLLLISFLLSHELYKQIKQKNILKFHVLKFSPENSLMLVENSKNLEFSQTVSIYYEFNKFQIPLALGFVENITDNFTQIKILKFENDFIKTHNDEYKKLLNNNKESLDFVLIKSYYRYDG
jgi:hypothetical protein